MCFALPLDRKLGMIPPAGIVRANMGLPSFRKRAYPYPRTPATEVSLNEFVQKTVINLGHHPGVEFVRVEARGASLRHWCDKFDYPEEMTFRPIDYRMETAVMFGEEFVRRGEHFYHQWLRADSPSDFVYTFEDHIQEYREGEMFHQFMDSAVSNTCSAYRMGGYVRRMFPRYQRCRMRWE